MAFIAGFVTKEERARLEARGWEVEDASRYGLVGSSENHLMEAPQGDDTEAIVVFVDSNVLDVMSGPDWDQDPDDGKTIPSGPPTDPAAGLSEAPPGARDDEF